MAANTEIGTRFNSIRSRSGSNQLNEEGELVRAVCGNYLEMPQDGTKTFKAEEDISQYGLIASDLYLLVEGKVYFKLA